MPNISLPLHGTPGIFPKKISNPVNHPRHLLMTLSQRRCDSMSLNFSLSQSFRLTYFENSFRLRYKKKSSEFSLVMTIPICRLSEMVKRTIIFIKSRNGFLKFPYTVFPRTVRAVQLVVLSSLTRES